MMEIRVPRVVADLLVGPERRLIRPESKTVDDVLHWLHDQEWPTDAVNSDAKRRNAVYHLVFVRRLIETGQTTDQRRGDRWPDDRLDGLGYGG